MPLPLRNIAIIAHVDHGKTTLVDHLLKQSGSFQSHEQIDERLMDSMDLEKERGITIAAKNASYIYRDTKINIVDTPGHSDFGGEVERVLDMVDGAILLVDASEGPLPQTRFVLSKALQQDLKILVCINKIDRADARTEEVLNEVFDLFIELDASDKQADFESIYTIAKDGIAVKLPNEKGTNLKPLLDWIVDKFPPPQIIEDSTLRLLVANLDYSDYVGRLAIGRIRSGSIKVGDEILHCKKNETKKIKVTALLAYKASKQVPVKEIHAGDIAILAGFDEVHIGDSLTSIENPQPLKRIKVDEPTVGFILSVNDSPFAGKEGKLVTSRKIKERLDKEILYNVALKIENTKRNDAWKVMGRGELQLAILLEQMRREGFEVLVSKPQVLFKSEDGQKTEPMELAVIDVEDSYAGIVTEKLGQRKGILQNVGAKGSGRTRMTFLIPSRGLIGYRSEFLTDTRGTGLLNTVFNGYEAYKGDLQHRSSGAIIADRTGKATPYAMDSLHDRGKLFITPGSSVYEGMVIGEANKNIHLNVNITKEKKLTNVRASGTDDAVRIAPIRPMTIEQSLEWISDEELIEVTPLTIRIRCKKLDQNERKRSGKNEANRV